MIWIGLDDTDMRGWPGTGHLARDLAAWLGKRLPLFGVTRHQLLRDPRIPMTAKNSAVAIHLRSGDPALLPGLADDVARWVRRRAAPGSRPGICLAWEVPEEVMRFGRRAQREVVTREEALALVATQGVILRDLGENGNGVIGALAAVGLAATGNDGRFVLYRRLREVRGWVSVAELLAEGIAQVQTVAGEAVTQGMVDTGNKLRPSLVGGRPVLWVKQVDDHWVAVRRD